MRLALPRSPMIPLMIGAIFLCTALLPAQEEAAPSAAHPLDRVVVIGASMSGGFGLGHKIDGVSANLSHYIDAGIAREHRPVSGYGSGMFFMDPEGTAQEQLAQALATDPTCVVGIDFLFWFFYGSGMNRAGRDALLERGLAMLETIPCPVLVGDLPDMHIALKGKGPFGRPLISPSQVPPVADIDAANVRIHAWIKTHERMHLVSLKDMTERIRSGEEIELAGQTLPARPLEDYLQSDLLHPNNLGSAAAAALVLYTIDQAHESVKPEDLAIEVAAIEKQVLSAGASDPKAARARRKLERKQRLEERRREREKEKAGN